MALAKYDDREINAKVLLYGPPGAGVSQNLYSLLRLTASGDVNEQMSRDSLLEFLPVSAGKIGGFDFRLHLFAYPRSTALQTLAGFILHGLDGVIFVADSQVERMVANLEAKEALGEMLAEEESKLAMVYQYNKRDVEHCIPVDILHGELNSEGRPEHEAIARQGVGTLSTLQSMLKLLRSKLPEEMGKDRFE